MVPPLEGQGLNSKITLRYIKGRYIEIQGIAFEVELPFFDLQDIRVTALSLPFIRKEYIEGCSHWFSVLILWYYNGTIAKQEHVTERGTLGAFVFPKIIIIERVGSYSGRAFYCWYLYRDTVLESYGAVGDDTLGGAAVGYLQFFELRILEFHIAQRAREHNGFGGDQRLEVEAGERAR